MADTDIVFVSAVRTAQGRFQGGFSSTPAVDLAALVMGEALKRAGASGEQLTEVVFGNVIQAGMFRLPRLRQGLSRPRCLSEWTILAEDW